MRDYKHKMWDFTYLPAGEIGICSRGDGLILNLTQGMAGHLTSKEVEAVTRHIVEVHNKSI